jgi:hypothetical protein
LLGTLRSGTEPYYHADLSLIVASPGLTMIVVGALLLIVGARTCKTAS